MAGAQNGRRLFASTLAMARQISFRNLVVLPLLAASGLFGACARDSEAHALHAAADSIRTDSVARARQDSINRTLPGYVIDSILPVEEELRRFRGALGGDSATRFAGGSDSREALVRRFVKALVANDTSELVAMVIHGREFADLYYPESPYTHPPTGNHRHWRGHSSRTRVSRA